MFAKTTQKNAQELKKLLKGEEPVKKISHALFFFLLFVAIAFDIIGLIPFLSSVMFMMFAFMVQIQLRMAGYSKGIAVTLINFFGNLLVDAIIPFWFACTLLTVVIYFSNNWLYEQEQKLLNNHKQ